MSLRGRTREVRDVAIGNAGQLCRVNTSTRSSGVLASPVTVKPSRPASRNDGALSGVMTDDPLERTSLNSYRMSLAQIGGIIANSSFIVLIAKFGAGNQQLGA